MLSEPNSRQPRPRVPAGGCTCVRAPTKPFGTARAQSRRPMALSDAHQQPAGALCSSHTQESNGSPLPSSRPRACGPAFFVRVKGKREIPENFSGQLPVCLKRRRSPLLWALSPPPLRACSSACGVARPGGSQAEAARSGKSIGLGGHRVPRRKCLSLSQHTLGLCSVFHFSQML